MEELVKEIKELLQTKDFAKLKEYLKEINSVDISSLFDELKGEEIILIYRLLEKSSFFDMSTE